MNVPYTDELRKTGRALKRWEAELCTYRMLALLAGWIAVCALTDMLIDMPRAGRTVTALGTIALAGTMLVRVIRILQRPMTPEAVAARIERVFPELDNHLINHLQFSASTCEHDPFRLTYLEQEAPDWRSLDTRKMKDRRAHRRGIGAFAGVIMLMVLARMLMGPALTAAAIRVLNPLSNIEPVTLTRLLAVNPGDTSVLQGAPLQIEAVVRGYPGHAVRIEVDPVDGSRETVEMGTIKGGENETLRLRVPRVNVSLRYRVRAGDAKPSDWFTVEARPPPAFTAVRLEVRPPSYTGGAAASLDALNEEVTVHEGAVVEVTAFANVPLSSAQLIDTDGTVHPMTGTGGDAGWSGSFMMRDGTSFALRAVDTSGIGFEERIPCRIIPDRQPSLEILAPRGRVRLPPGQAPAIEFSVTDDYGLYSAEILLVTGADEDGQADAVVRRWPLEGARATAGSWMSDSVLRSGDEATYRVVVTDNHPDGGQRVRSMPLTFSASGHRELADERDGIEKKTAAGLRDMIELQRTNIDQTEKGLTAEKDPPADFWFDVARRQQDIRSMTRELLAAPFPPFGGLTPVVKRLYVNEMNVAVRLLDELPGVGDDVRAARGAEALSVQRDILKQLQHAQVESAGAAAERRFSALSAMLDALVRGQGLVIGSTRMITQTAARVGAPLVDSQDALASDLTAFRNACLEEAANVRGTDEAFSFTLDSLADNCESWKIRDQMLLAADRLDRNLPADALPFAERSLAALQALQETLNGVALKRETEKRTVLVGALGDAKERLERVSDLRRRMLDSMDEVRGNDDQGEGIEEAFEEAYVELKSRTKDVVLDIPDDLHTFADMLAANDLVEDVFQIFQEIEQTEGTESGEQETALLDFAKEDANLELMDEAIERIDELETWLLEEPDAKRVTAEAFDREEMPEDGVAKGELADAVEDLISDLLEEDEQQEEDAQDSASTHGVTDMLTGWGVEEGETVTFSAKGKSGNRTPDHKEQDGRSNIGRQGMAVGETAAASGTISEGDKNIEARRTEDPTQAGRIDLSGDADTRATGGGKLASGKADDYGMSGGVKRMDSSEEGSWEGMAAVMAKRADTIYARASLKNIRVDALKEAAHHLRQSGDAIAEGSIEQVREFRKQALASLREAHVRIEAGVDGGIDQGGALNILDDVVEGGSDMAPPAYRDEVADYFRALNDFL